MTRICIALALLSLVGCRIEDRTPRGSLQDQATIQKLIIDYHRVGVATDAAGDPAPRDLRPVRTDLRQEGNLATAWVLLRPADSRGGEVLEHFVLRRDGGQWRVVHVAVATSRRPPAPRP
jgi:hypothetical protein